jgi:DNA-binding PadR family transcriptional regulator
MIQLLILYYLSLKSTHGYEIQKFVQLNQMDEWNNIQSGSIYYAMSKLEKEGLIELVEKIGSAEKSKRIFAITGKGRKKLADMALMELKKPLGSISSEKFLIYPIMANLSKQEMLSAIREHITSLEKELEVIVNWVDIKHTISSKVENATLELMRNTVENQIKWHKCMAENIDEAITASLEISRLIKTVDFSDSAELSRFGSQ